MALYYWICPVCGTSVYEDYLECNCGYFTTREEVEKNKLELKEIDTRKEEIKKKEEEQKALEKKREEEKRLAFARQKEQQILEFEKRKEERLKSIEKRIEKRKEEKLELLEKQKEENKKVLQERLSELKELFDTGIITEEEHNRRRQTILDKFFETNGINQNKLVKKEEAKKEIKQGYINKNQLTSEHANRTYGKTNPKSKYFIIGSVIALIIGGMITMGRGFIVDVASLFGVAVNILLQVLLYRWLTIRLFLGNDKGRFEKNKVAFYVLFVFIAIILYLIVKKNA